MSSESPKKSLLQSPLVNIRTSSPSLGRSSDRWILLCDRSETQDDGLYSYEIPKGEYQYPILLMRVGGSLYALHDECPHRRVPISDRGYINEDVVYCGYHNWGFKIDIGAHTMPTGVCVDRYDVREEDDKVYIKVSW